MSNASNFYVTLPSNGSKRFFPDNTAGVYRNNLAQPLELEGQWEVALVEIQFPITWKLLTKDMKTGLAYFHKDTIGKYKLEKKKAQFKLIQPWTLFAIPLTSQLTHSDNFSLEDLRLGMNKFTLSLTESVRSEPSELNYTRVPISEGRTIQVFEKTDGEFKSVDYVEVTLASKYYHNTVQVATDLTEYLRKEIREKTKINDHVPSLKINGVDPVAFGCEYEKDTSVLQFYTDIGVENSKCGMIMYKSSEELSRLLGFESLTEEVSFHAIPFKSRSVRPLMKFNTPALYVYTDIVADELVGDAKVPLLRTVPIDGQMGDFMHREFIRPYYKRLSKGYISSILIEVKDDTGKDIDFTQGKVICNLHFRRCGLAV